MEKEIFISFRQKELKAQQLENISTGRMKKSAERERL